VPTNQLFPLDDKSLYYWGTSYANFTFQIYNSTHPLKVDLSALGSERVVKLDTTAYNTFFLLTDAGRIYSFGKVPFTPQSL